MIKKRPPIPAELKNQVLAEAGHHYTISTCRYIDVDVHHIIPWEQCKKYEYENLTVLFPNCRRRADREGIGRKALQIYNANLRFTIEKYFQFEMNILFELSKAMSGYSLPFPNYIGLLIRSLHDEGIVRIIKTESEILLGSVKINPDFLVITEKCQEFVESVVIKDIGC